MAGITCENLVKTYVIKDVETKALRGVDLAMESMISRLKALEQET